MDKLAVAIGVIVLVGLIALIVKYLRDDSDTSRPASGSPFPVERTQSQAAASTAVQAGTPRPEPAPVTPDRPAPEPTVDRSDAPMARRVPRAERPEAEPQSQPAAEQPPAAQPVVPAARTAPSAPATAPVAEAPSQPPAEPVQKESSVDAMPRRQVMPPPGDALPVRRATGEAGAARRAPEPLVKPGERRGEAPRDPEAVRRSMSGLQAGLARARRAADESGEPPASR